MIRKSISFKVLSFLAMCLLGSSVFAQANLDEGKDLFRNNCASCHNKNMKSKMTGPALGAVEERWESEELLYAWIKNSQGVIATGNTYAVNLYNEYNQSQMQAFPNLTDENIANILAYIDFVYVNGAYPAPEGGGAVAAASGSEETSNSIYWIILGVLVVLSLILAQIVSNLEYLKNKKETGTASRKTLVDILTSKGVVGLVVFALIVFCGYTTINSAVNLNRQQGYEPDQPIKFSHKTHAGVQQIECQYCHDGARRSKHSVIPAANTCINCHKAIKVGSQHGTAEITKIFASTGFNPLNDTYLTNPTNEEAEKVYKEWMSVQYNVEKGNPEDAALDNEGEELVNAQWDAIVSSLTTDVKETVYGPIPWVRIHNLPDHAYFNHAQHVTVGGIECQTCHGKVEEMEVLAQHAPLSMGWCINCHRMTNVNQGEVAKNYYEAHYQKGGPNPQLKVEDIGGLECQKCHY